MANMAQAIRMALHYAENHLELKDIFGQDVGPPLGGIFTATQGLKTAWNTPLDERGIVGMAAGIAMTGDRCVAEIQFADYIFNTIDLLKLIGNTHWCSNGQMHLPLVLRIPVGAGIRGSVYHSHSFDSWACRIQGWKIIIPSTPLDAYGLLISAIEDPNPVMFLEPKALLRVRGKELIPGEPTDQEQLKQKIDAPVGDLRKKWSPNFPDLKYLSIPIGRGHRLQEGTDVTVISYGRMVLFCMQATHAIEQNSGVSIEVIDLRSVYPYDWTLIKDSVSKTKRVLFVGEDTEVVCFQEHLMRRVIDELFYELLAKPRVLAAQNVPGVGLHENLEEATIPQIKNIQAEIEAILNEAP